MILLLATAFALDRVEGADTLAMGSAATANPWAQAGVSANPAIIATDARYHYGVGFAYGDRGLHWNITAVDTVTSPVSFGLTYSGDRANPPLTPAEYPGWQVPGQAIPNLKRNHDLGAALSIPMADRRFSIGLGGSLSFFDHDRQGKGTGGNMTGGIAGRPVPGVALGVSARNFLPVRDVSEDRPFQVMGGAWVGEVGLAALSIDGGYDLDTRSPVLAAGFEVYPATQAALRAGWRLEDDVNHLAVGAGGGTPDASFDLGIQVPVPQIAKPIDWTFQLSIRFRGPQPDDIRPPR